MRAVSVWYPGVPKSKTNSRWNRNGRFYTDRRYQAWEDGLAWKLKAAWRGSPPLTICSVEATFSFKDHRRRDLDNLLKGCGDALTRASIIRDDADICKWTAWKLTGSYETGVRLGVRDEGQQGGSE